MIGKLLRAWAAVFWPRLFWGSVAGLAGMLYLYFNGPTLHF